MSYSSAPADFSSRREAPSIHEIDLSDLRAALNAGFADFLRKPSYAVVLLAVYPLIGLLLLDLVLGRNLYHLAFPLLAGFALVGPFAAIVLYELSRQAERGEEMSWVRAARVLVRPSIWPALALGGVLFIIFAAWISTASAIYAATLGEAPRSAGEFLRAVFTTEPGLRMAIYGCVAGFGFALVVLAISVIAFPMLIDRPVGLATAVVTSVSAVATSPVTFAVWGIIVAAGLAAGFATALLGLTVVLPVLGHATWHLYRRTVR